MSQVVYRAKVSFQQTSLLAELVRVFDLVNARIERGYGRLLDGMADYVVKKMEL